MGGALGAYSRCDEPFDILKLGALKPYHQGHYDRHHAKRRLELTVELHFGRSIGNKRNHSVADVWPGSAIPISGSGSLECAAFVTQQCEPGNLPVPVAPSGCDMLKHGRPAGFPG